jgi:hypothetical protein
VFAIVITFDRVRVKAMLPNARLLCWRDIRHFRLPPRSLVAGASMRGPGRLTKFMVFDRFRYCLAFGSPSSPLNFQELP